MSDVSVTAHRHQWKVHARIDYCHFVETRRRCRDCGAEGSEFKQRDFASDPLEICFADRDCAVCRELAERAGVEEPWAWRLKP